MVDLPLPPAALEAAAIERLGARAWVDAGAAAVAVSNHVGRGRRSRPRRDAQTRRRPQ